jgi:RNA polymerase sigma-70 factor (ECF subfamily)
VKSGSENESNVCNDWEGWLDQHSPGLLLYARQQTRSEADAQDVLQEAVVEAWQRQDRGDLPSPALVYATIRRRAIDLARSRARRETREAGIAADAPVVWFDPGPESRERARLIEESMRTLPEYYREVVTLKIWGGLTFAEIASALDIPANTAASRYRYGIEALRENTREALS